MSAEIRLKEEEMRRVVLKWFSFHGRAGRGTFWLVNIVNVILFVLACGPVMAVASTTNFVVAGMALLLLVPSTASIGARRFRDRNWSGAWVALYPVPTLIAMIAGKIGLPPLLFVSIAISTWLFVELGILRGTRGENRFGRDPCKQRSSITLMKGSPQNSLST
jgi:uncharacterized membrane protein YhaH (DUF805 family)